MKKVKLKLDELKVTSFTTSETNNLKGGSRTCIITGTGSQSGATKDYGEDEDDDL